MSNASIIEVPHAKSSYSIANGQVVSVSIHADYYPVSTQQIQRYIDEGFSHPHALAACLAERNVDSTEEDSQMLYGADY